METITFEGPFHISELEKIDKSLHEKKGSKIPGIYIWGFVSDKSKSNFERFSDLVEPKFNPKKMCFIPYYVGLDSNLFDRLKKHKGFDKHDATKYTRMSQEYMLTFFNDKKYPIKTNNSDIHKSYLAINKYYEVKKIIYYNNSIFLQDTYGLNCKVNIVKTQNPIMVFNNENNKIINLMLEDTLKKLYDDSNRTNHKNNLWFCYAKLGEKKEFIDCKLIEYEALTFYSLKGKTISKTIKYNELNNNLKIIDNTTANIFNKDSNNNVFTIDFENIKEIPGY